MQSVWKLTVTVSDVEAAEEALERCGALPRP